VLVWGNLSGQSSTLTGSTFSGATSFVMPYSGTANDPLLSAASTATVTNKTFSGASNAWQGGVIGAAYGGTGVNNGSSTATLGGNLSTAGAVTFSGAFSFTGTLTAATAVTFPTSGTLMANPMTTAGDLIYGGASGAATRLPIGSNGNCLTVASGNPAWGACGSASPGGSTTQVQFNSAGSFGGSSALTWSSPTLTIGVQGTTLGQLALASSAAFTATLAPSASQTVSYTLTLPPTAGAVSQCLQNNGTTPGVLTFGSCGGTATLAVGTTTTSGGAAGQIMYDTGSLLQEAANLIYDTTNFDVDLYRVTGTNFEEMTLGWQTVNSNPVATWQITKGGAGTQRSFAITSGGLATSNIVIDFGVFNANTLDFGYNGTFDACFAGTWCYGKTASKFQGANTAIFGWASASSGLPSNNADTTLCRQAAGAVEVNSGTGCGTGGTIRAKVMGTPTGYTVGTLPASPTTGDRTYVTDATSCTFLGSVTGGGSTFCPVIYNGSAWLGQ
jgi:hypothetical protein